MSTVWIENKITDFRHRLSYNDKEDFDQRLAEESSNLDLGGIRDNLESNFRTTENHLELVQAAASGFNQTELADGYSSGYEFAFTEPLEEQNSEYVGDYGVSNGDVLLVKIEGQYLYLCIIECKAGATAGRDWVSELGDIEEVLKDEQYLEIIKSQLGEEHREVRHIQYVLLGMTTQVIAMNYDSIVDDVDIPPNYAFWGYSPGEQQMVHIHGEVADDSLNQAISNSIDTGKAANPIDFTYNDHPLTQLRNILEDIIKSKLREDPHPFEFTQFEFSKRFSDSLQAGFQGNVREELIHRRVEYLIEVGLKSGILVDTVDRLNSDRDFRIYFRGRTPKAALDSARNKYFDWRSEQRQKELAFEIVREEFEALPPQAQLDEDRFFS